MRQGGDVVRSASASDQTGLVFSNGRAVTRSHVARAWAEGNGLMPGDVRTGSAFEAAKTRGTFFTNWRPGLRSADADWLPDRDAILARVRDVGRNDPVAASIVTRRVNSAVGTGWRRISRPDAEALGITREQAVALGCQIEGEWRRYAQGSYFQADATRRFTFGQLMRSVAHHVMFDGEGLGLIEWDEGANTRYKTRLRVVDPDRLSNPNGRPDSDTLRGGVETDLNGVAWRYWVREAHPADLASTRSMTWSAWDRFTDWGRPRVCHAFEMTRAGQTRGISRFVAALKSIRGLSRYTDAQIEAAAINAMFVAFIKSNAGPAAVSESFTTEDLGDWASARDQGYSDNPVNLANGARMPVLALGDEIEMQTASRDVSDYEPFARSIIRLTCALLGTTYEEGAMDYSNTNYSSAQAAAIPAYKETEAFRGNLDAQVASPFHLAWLEEAFDRGYVVPPPGAPTFEDMPEAYAEGRWVYPPRGYIDQTKEIDAAAARIEAGTSTLQKECAEQGEDWEEITAQRALERDRLRELGLEAPQGALSLAAQAARQPAAPTAA